MATVKPIKPKKPVDYVGYEPTMLALALSKARACAWLLEESGRTPDNPIIGAISGYRAFEAHAEDIRGWLHLIAANQLLACLNEIEREYRKLGTNLLQKETPQRTSASFARLAAPPGDERLAGGAVGRGSRKGAPGEPRGRPDGAQAARAEGLLRPPDHEKPKDGA